MLDAEAPDVSVGGESVGDQDVGGQQLQVVIGDEGPDREIGALGDGAGEADDEGKDS